MAIRELPRVKTKRYTVDDVWALECDPANEGRYFYLIDGELLEDPMPSPAHGELANLIAFYMTHFVLPRGIGKVLAETSVAAYPGSATYLVPDVSFVSAGSVPSPPPATYLSTMPDIAVEIKSPSNTVSQLRRKADAYLRHGATIVWLVIPERQGVEQWQLDADGEMQHFFINRQGTLHGEPALPGFTLELSLLFPLDT